MLPNEPSVGESGWWRLFTLEQPQRQQAGTMCHAHRSEGRRQGCRKHRRGTMGGVGSKGCGKGKY